VACYHPLRAQLSPQGKISFSMANLASHKPLALPCGRCIGCRQERSRQWAVRLMHEAQMHVDSSFLTLTYSDENLPVHGSLVKSDPQLFLKRFRARVSPARVRHYLVGEYGEISARPHYHALIFGWSFPDKVFARMSGEHPIFTSELLSSCWPLGHAWIGSVSFESASYCAGYLNKKITGEPSKAHYGKRIPEFAFMSKRPGIGRAWFDKFSSDVFPSDSVVVRGKESRPPRYYSEAFKSCSPDEFEAIRAKRETFASQLNEKVTFRDGSFKMFRASDVPSRLAAREIVARAKLSLKKKTGV